VIARYCTKLRNHAMPSPNVDPSPFVGNADVRIVEERVLAHDWYLLRKTTFEHRRRDGRLQVVSRETYDRGNGVALLLFNAARGTVILIRQFRFPAWVNGCADGMLVEACAGLLDGNDPLAAMRREAIEETGYAVKSPRKVFEAYMSPGSVTEKLHFFVAAYDDADRQGAGGGEAHEGEDIEVLELPLARALAMIASGEIQDGKTIMLLQHAAMAGLENL
jgi:nudix-type nucleoside diphosphatase (YffH/AdpP family)